jgi:hypothetical protein
MRTIDNSNAKETYKQYAKEDAKNVGKEGVKLAILGDRLETKSDEVFAIPTSNEVRNWEAQTATPDVNTDDTDVSEIDGGEKTNEDIFKSSEDLKPEVPGLEGFSVVDKTDAERDVEEDDEHDDVPEDVKDVLGEPDDEEK